jgi:hypothetical protein
MTTQTLTQPTISYSSEDVVTARKNNSLKQWVDEFLLDEGNHSLATELKNNKSSLIEILDFTLSKLKKIEGPEEVTNRESLDVWEERVSKLTKLIEQGQSLPPIIVTDFWQPLEIADGNHRHEALLRSGRDKYWTIFFLKNEENKQLLAQYPKHDEN